MNFSDNDKYLLLHDTKVFSRITVYKDGVELYQFDEDDCLSEWTYEDFRYVPENGFIGQFTERLLDGKLNDLPTDYNINDCEILVELGVHNPDTDEITYYKLGNFLITKVENEDTSGVVSFEASDYAKKFNTLYKDTISYPCSALELLNNVCSQVGVDFKYNGDAFVVNAEDSIGKGSYYFLYNGTYYIFTLSNDLKAYESLMYISSTNKLIVKTLDTNYQITRSTISFTTSTSVPTSGQLIEGNIVKYVDFINNDFVIIDNQFESDESCREVIKAIAKLGYTWARINEDNELVLDFYPKSANTITEYTTIDSDQYYDCSVDGDKYGPVSKVLIGLSNVEGENVTEESEGFVVATEVPEDIITENVVEIVTEDDIASGRTLAIYDNPLTYTEVLRRIAINGCDVLFGLTYTPVTIESIGHPWLYGNDCVQVTNLNGEIFNTYLFDRSIVYSGYIKSTLTSTSESVTETTYSYNSELQNRLTHAEIIVNKNEASISAITEQVTTLQGDYTAISGKYDDLKDDIGLTNGSIEKLTERVETTQTSTYTKTQVQQILSGNGFFVTNDTKYKDNVSYYSQADSSHLMVKGTDYNVGDEITSTVYEYGAVSAVVSNEATFDKDGMRYSKTNAPTSTLINYKGLEVDNEHGDELLFSGVDETTGESIVRTQNLTVSTYCVVGQHGRFEKYTDPDSNTEGVGLFLL